jgi:hypothetical protein
MSTYQGLGLIYTIVFCSMILYNLVFIVLLAVYSYKEIYNNNNMTLGIAIVICNVVNTFSLIFFPLQLYCDFQNIRQNYLAKIGGCLQIIFAIFAYVLFIHNCAIYKVRCYNYTTPLYIILIIYTHVLFFIGLIYSIYNFRKLKDQCLSYCKKQDNVTSQV